MSNILMSENSSRLVPESVTVKRSDPVYMAHAYLTKIPVSAITPFIEAFTRPGETVLDPFAGSGMTGVAAATLGRKAHLFDIAVLGEHIGRNYLNLVDPTPLRNKAAEVVAGAEDRIGDAYTTPCSKCGRAAQIVKTVWSMVMECKECLAPVVFYRAIEEAEWNKRWLRCINCSVEFSSRAKRIGEVPVLDSIICLCSQSQIEQEWSAMTVEPCHIDLEWPDEPIEESRQMFIASALGKHGLTTTASFYSRRNLCALSSLKAEIDSVEDRNLQEKLKFCFTAILTRASKRYQWSKNRPLNAVNSNYYVAPVFYEWNVFDLFSRKVEAAVKSDSWIKDGRLKAATELVAEPIGVTYDIASADSVPLPDDSVDYVFTDPPFGSNIFYSDMNLFQEAWLGNMTDPTQEAVIDRIDTGNNRTPDRYEKILTDALMECRRVLKPEGYITMVFGSSSGLIWEIVQRSLKSAGLVVIPEFISILDKGQRSVKGLTSEYANVATLDLVLTMQAGSPDQFVNSVITPDRYDLEEAIQRIVGSSPLSNYAYSPSQLYLEVLRYGFRHGWDLSTLNLAEITKRLRGACRVAPGSPPAGDRVTREGAGS